MFSAVFSLLFLCFCVVYGADDNENSNIIDISGVKLYLLELQVLPETGYSVHNKENNIYQIYTKIGIKNESGKTKKLEWEYTVRWDGPMAIELKSASGKTVLPKGYPFGGNCCPEYMKIRNKEKAVLRNLSEAYYIEDLDSDYVITIQGKIKVNNSEEKYAFTVKKNLKEILNVDFWGKKALRAE